MAIDYIERLAHIVRVLDNVPKTPSAKNGDDPLMVCERPFYIGRWMSACGTSACAIGWAAQDSWFRARGLKVTLNSDGSTYFPVFGRLNGLDAVTDFMGLTLEEAYKLFMPGSYNGGSSYNVSQRIRSKVLSQFRKLPVTTSNLKRYDKIINLMEAA